MRKRQGLILGAVLFFGLRVYATFSIYPGNAPDEIGHMTIASALSRGHLLTLLEEQSATGYPYSMYNPLGYFPSAAVLGVASQIDPLLNTSKKPPDFSVTASVLARIGHLFWTALYLFFLVLLLKDLPWVTTIFCGIVLGLLPQLVFTQSYVNLDAIGLPFLLYLIWACLQRKPLHIAVSSFFLLNSKLTFLPSLGLPIVCFALWNHNSPKKMISDFCIYLGIPLLFGSSWSIFNHFHNLTEIGAHTTLGVLKEISDGGSSAFWVFSRLFIDLSTESSFAMFGWMNQPIPPEFYSVWQYGFLAPGALILSIMSGLGIMETIKTRNTPTGRKTLSIGLLAVVLLNAVAHFWASAAISFQPQGRYLFPAVVSIIFGLGIFLGESIPTRFRLPLWASLAGVAIFFTFALLTSFSEMSKNPIPMGFALPHPSFENRSSIDELGTIYEDRKITQGFIPKETTIRAIFLPMTTHFATIVDGQVEIGIFDKKNKWIAKKTIPLERLIQNRVLPVIFNPPLTVIPKEMYFLAVGGKGIPFETPISVYRSEETDGRQSDRMSFAVFSSCAKNTSYRWPFEREDCEFSFIR